MEDSKYKSFFDRLYYKTYNMGKRIGKDISISAFFTIEKENKKLADNDKASIINELRTMAEYYQPEKIMVIVDPKGVKKVYQEEFMNNNSETQTINRNLQTSDSQIPEFSNNSQTINSLKKELLQPNLGFQGFGALSVEDYINKKLDEDRKERKLSDLEIELGKKKEEIVSLKETIKNLEEEISESEDENEDLLGQLESKKTIRYWAGLTGDILDSIGLKKEMLKEPLAGLIASEKQDNKQLAEQAHQKDESGFVEDNPEQDKRSEIITLIADYLKTVDNQTLSNVFTIFSEIEKDNYISTVLVEQLSNKK